MLRIISGNRKGALIHEVDRAKTRPTTDKNKEMVFNTIGQYFSGGVALDLFAGSGSLGLEALSRGFQSCHFVDSSPEAALTIRKNLQKLRFPLGEIAFIHEEDVVRFLSKEHLLKYDLIMIDPPYASSEYGFIMDAIAANDLLSDSAQVVVETIRDKQLETSYGNLALYRKKPSGHSNFYFYRHRPSHKD
ncbi:MAG: 16S rRNA (guanine(966)-N(2))-methyltransferase RsmD [Candidatus Izemoplasmatales bacterium]|jgi:16S rRNA (guanine(966)-N(2))-methyltransferase RsmD